MPFQGAAICRRIIRPTDPGFIDDDPFAIDSAMDTGVDQSRHRAGRCIDERLWRVHWLSGRRNLPYERKLPLHDRHMAMRFWLRTVPKRWRSSRYVAALRRVGGAPQ